MDSCFFCGAVELNSGTTRYEKLSAKVPSSQKTVSLVLTHLANCINTPLDVKTNSRLCPRCFIELSDYDTIMVNLMTTQKRLTNQLKHALKSEFDAPESGEDLLVEEEEEVPLEEEDTDADAEAEALFVELVKDQDDSDTEIKREYDDDEEKEFLCEVEVGESEETLPSPTATTSPCGSASSKSAAPAARFTTRGTSSRSTSARSTLSSRTMSAPSAV